MVVFCDVSPKNPEFKGPMKSQDTKRYLYIVAVH